ncbi:Organic hydroperoxide reductase OsmC/OhrA [Pedococcus dokdonensis]|uniref:Organic hydroperoxide reductase OsmC/OhrA n=1 Tax=Pedococcus dokdonensis TaxID=443156 RepID=A0A1H0MQZ6_9MICO|nr:OsmC family protein [Pedococcus dokdonensis]SDO82797.1 Organic hydroperoxide reductase OsmC/OhrA [Pedococcus dokdonensis]
MPGDDFHGHTYLARVEWDGSTGAGYRAYPRAHTAWAPPAPEPFDLSADPHFRGDSDLPNPEQLLVVAASSCQLLSFLAVAARGGVDVLAYRDEAFGEMPDELVPQRITRIVLRPRVQVAAGTDLAGVERMLHEAHEQCYIANSLTTEVVVEAEVQVRPDA